MKTSLLMLLIMTSGMVGGLGVAEAEDFNFTVPVRLSNIQADIVEVRVYCSVAATVDRTILGSLAVTVPLASGNFSGNVILKFNAFPGRDPATATTYRCVLQTATSLGMGIAQVSQAKAGAPFTPLVEGTLPP